MTTLYNIELTINLPDGSRQTRQLVNLYFPEDMAADINKTALSECGASDEVLSRKFAKLTLKRADVWASQAHSLEIFILLSVLGENPAFVKQVITRYIEALPEYLKKASGGYFARGGFPPGISLLPTDWKVEVN